MGGTACDSPLLLILIDATSNDAGCASTSRFAATKHATLAAQALRIIISQPHSIHGRLHIPELGSRECVSFRRRHPGVEMFLCPHVDVEINADCLLGLSP